MKVIQYISRRIKNTLLTFILRILIRLNTLALRYRWGFKFAFRTTQGIITLLHSPLRCKYSADSALSLTRQIINVSPQGFIKRYLQSRLMTENVRSFMARVDWNITSAFLQERCVLRKDSSTSRGQFMLCTHTGDYWLLILTLAKHREGENIDFVVPIYNEIDDKNAEMFSRIKIPGVNIIFINIHEDHALLKISRFLHNKSAVVAVFYDLSCYISGVYNGSVEPVKFMNKNGFMTTGIIRIASRSQQQVNIISCHYSETDYRYVIDMSPSHSLADLSVLKDEMISCLDVYLRVYPWQWHFINNLDSYFHYPYSKIQAKHITNLTLLQKLNNKYAENGGNNK